MEVENTLCSQQTETNGSDGHIPIKRSSGTLQRRRAPLPWPDGHEFRILSIDGGGIRGIFPAAFLGGLEQRYLDGQSIAEYFDLIVGTSTGGIIASGWHLAIPPRISVSYM